MADKLHEARKNRTNFIRHLRETCVSLFPIVLWTKHYSKRTAACDFVSGVSTGLVTVSQSIAYAGMCGLSAKIGLLCGVIGGLVYPLFGTIKEITVAPTAMLALLTNEFIQGQPIENTGFLTFGCAMTGFCVSILQLGWLIDFVSIPICSAFGSALALTIILSELRNVVGIRYKPISFVDSLNQFYSHAGDLKYADICLSVVSILIITAVGALEYLPIKTGNKYGNTIKSCLWFVSISKSTIMLCSTTIFTLYWVTYNGSVPYSLIDQPSPGFPKIQFPWEDVSTANSTLTFSNKIRTLYSGMIVMPLMSVVVHVCISKIFGTSGIRVGVNHELFSNSVCNLFGSFFNSSPMGGALTRSAVSSMSRVKTPVANFYTAAVLFMFLSLLEPYLQMIPKASLSVIIIIALIPVVDYKIILPLWRNCKQDLFIFVITATVALYFGLPRGLIMGMICNIVTLVYSWVRPSILVEKCQSEYGEFILVTADLGLFYPAVNHFEVKMMDTLEENDYAGLPAAINCVFFKGFDFTAMKGLIRIVKIYQQQNRNIIIFNADQKLIKFCRDLDENVSRYFLDDDKNYLLALFGDNLELREIKPKSIAKHHSNSTNGKNNKHSRSIEDGENGTVQLLQPV